ncbi:hypothetical protein HYC85_011759 [Camellia sinensis]|uniref:Uncharacterized protein n=1 Tax=Camellia sinensis TaxID=4442 RepID=A0A7J7HD75_CAMSI|nr:hypothetical protein HYC85_011759 [Camellia sinensis]
MKTSFQRVNVTVGEEEERMMMTGLHTAADILCIGRLPMKRAKSTRKENLSLSKSPRNAAPNHNLDLRLGSLTSKHKKAENWGMKSKMLISQISIILPYHLKQIGTTGHLGHRFSILAAAVMEVKLEPPPEAITSPCQ